jgi:hypothetical protein
MYSNFLKNMKDIEVDNLEEWCKEHNFEILKLPCFDCDEELELNIPFKSGESVGLRAGTCPHCKSENTPLLCAISIDERMLKKIIDEKFEKEPFISHKVLLAAICILSGYLLYSFLF